MVFGRVRRGSKTDGVVLVHTFKIMRLREDVRKGWKGLREFFLPPEVFFYDNFHCILHRELYRAELYSFTQARTYTRVAEIA